MLALQVTEERVPEQVHVPLEHLQPVCQAKIEQGALCQANFLSLKPLGSPCTSDFSFLYHLRSALEDMALSACRYRMRHGNVSHIWQAEGRELKMNPSPAS